MTAFSHHGNTMYYSLCILIYFSETYVNPDTDSLYKEGEILKLPRMGKTLETLSEEGAQAFYNGSLTKAVLEDMTEHNSGMIVHSNFGVVDVYPLNTTPVAS